MSGTPQNTLNNGMRIQNDTRGQSGDILTMHPQKTSSEHSIPTQQVPYKILPAPGAKSTSSKHQSKEVIMDTTSPSGEEEHVGNARREAKQGTLDDILAQGAGFDDIWSITSSRQAQHSYATVSSQFSESSEPAASVISSSEIHQPTVKPQAKTFPDSQPVTVWHKLKIPRMSQKERFLELQSIYDDILLVEAKCIEDDNKLAWNPSFHVEMSPTEMYKRVTLHTKLVDLHFDFLAIAQHPSAPLTFGPKYDMQNRLWRHGIFNFVMALRRLLPLYRDHLLGFIYRTYSLLAFIHEAYPAFQDTLEVQLGDLSRFGVAIAMDEEIWTNVARSWYTKALHKKTSSGMLYNCLGLLEPTDVLQQLFYCCKSFSVSIRDPFSAEFISKIFRRVLEGETILPPLQNAFVTAHRAVFTAVDNSEPPIQEFLGLLDSHIEREGVGFIEQGYYVASINSFSMLQAMSGSKEAKNKGIQALQVFQKANKLFSSTLGVVLRRLDDPNSLPFVYVTLAFILHLSISPALIEMIEPAAPWNSLILMLNSILKNVSTDIDIEDNPDSKYDPLPEDYAIRGQIWAINFFPDNWFEERQGEEQQRDCERPTEVLRRMSRILFIACCIARNCQCIYYDRSKRRFTSARC